MTINSKVLIIVEIDGEFLLYPTTKLITHLLTLRETKEVKLLAVYRKYYMWSDSYEVIKNQVKKQIELKTENLKQIEELLDKLYLQKVPNEFYKEYEPFNYEYWKKFADELNQTSLVDILGLFLEPVCEYMNKVDGKLVVQETKLPIEEQNLRGELYYNKQYDDTKIRKPK